MKRITVNKYTILFSTTLLLLGAVCGYFFGYQKKVSDVSISNTQALRENTNQYQFIHPLLAVNRTDIGTPSPVYVSLYNKVNDFFSQQKKLGLLDTASVYFINYGSKSGSFAINEKARYAPASLLKVVIMVAYLKQADSHPELLDRKYMYVTNIADNLEAIPFSSPSTLVIGQSYSVSDLIDAMIIHSDNGAMNLLADNIDPAYLSTVYSDLGLKGPGDSSAYTISAEDYSLFFRILFNGTYLSDKNSERALSILSKAVFSDGLVAGVPAGTVVAHKFGEHINSTSEQVSSIELHDCGYIYAKQGPYLLCIMTRGKTLDGVQSTISGISKLIYSYL